MGFPEVPASPRRGKNHGTSLHEEERGLWHTNHDLLPVGEGF